MSARKVVLEPGDASCARFIDVLRAEPALSLHVQRVVLALYLAHRAGDEETLGDLPDAWDAMTRAERNAFKRAVFRWTRESGWYDTARLVLAS